MTVHEIIDRFEDYYIGGYGEKGRDTMVAYFKRFPEDFLPHLYAVALKQIKRSYKVAPGVAELEEIMDEAELAYRAAKSKAIATKAVGLIEDQEEYVSPERFGELHDYLTKLAASKSVDS